MVCGLSMAESENAEVRQVADENVEMRHLATEKRKETIAPTVSDENKEIEKKQVAEENMKEKTAVTTTTNIKDMNWKILEEGKKELQKLDIGWNTMREIEKRRIKEQNKLERLEKVKALQRKFGKKIVRKLDRATEEELKEKLKRKLELAEMKKNLWTCYRVGGNLVRPEMKKKPVGMAKMMEKKEKKTKKLKLEEKKEEMRACVLIIEQMEDWGEEPGSAKTMESRRVEEEEKKKDETTEAKEKRKLTEEEKLSEQDSPAKKRKTEKKKIPDQISIMRKNTLNQDRRRKTQQEAVTVLTPVTVGKMNPTPVTVNELRNMFERIKIEAKTKKMTSRMKDPNKDEDLSLEVLSLDKSLKVNKTVLKNMTVDQNVVRENVTDVCEKVLKEKTVLNIGTRREPEPSADRLTRELADNFEKMISLGEEELKELKNEEFKKLEKFEEKAAGMRFVKKVYDRKFSPNRGLRIVDQAEQLEARTPPLPPPKGL